MNPWEEDLIVEEAQKEAMPWEEDLKVSTPRGANFGGYVRNIAQNIPLLGTRADELEATIRSNKAGLAAGMMGFSGLSRLLQNDAEYEKYRRNAEESALGNEANAPYGEAAALGTNIAGNMALAALTRGLTLNPYVSAAQGIIEGSGRGSNPEERAINAAVSGSINFAVPAVFNKVAPTKGITTKTINKYAKRSLETAKNNKDVSKIIMAKSIKEGAEPSEIIANEVSKGYRPALWNNLKRASEGENVLRESLYKSAAETRRPLYDQYIEQEVRKVSPQYATKIGQNIRKLKLDEKGTDLLVDFDSREIARNAINEAMQDASQAERASVENAINNAFAKRGVANDMIRALVPNPTQTAVTKTGAVRFLGDMWKNAANRAFLNIINPKWTLSNALRGAVDTMAETPMIKNLENFKGF